MIEYIREGMSASQVFDILNRLIEEHNQMMTALGGALTDGQFDYSALANKPKINGIVLEDDINPGDILPDIDNALVERVNDFSQQLQNYTQERSGYVERLHNVEQAQSSASSRIATLEGEKSARETDLATYKATINGLVTGIGERMTAAETRETNRNTAFLQRVETVESALNSKEDTIRDLAEIRRGAASGATAYQKPSTGIPATDMDPSARTSLSKADTAYQKPVGGIPSMDMDSNIRSSLTRADTAYQKPAGGIPKTDMDDGVNTSLRKADSAYQKPGNGIPASDMAAAVQTTLGKADTAIQTHQSLASYPTTNDWQVLLSQFQTIQNAASTSATAASNSATAAANSATVCDNECTIATEKAQQAQQAAQSVSGAISRIADLEDSVNGTQQTQGLATRTRQLEDKLGDVGEKVSVSADLKETREKSNTILAALKEVPEVYEKVKEIAALDVNYNI